MLRIIQNQNAAAAQSYYSHADYYSEGQELIGAWGGHAAAKLGLSGEVDRFAFQALCENRHPQTGAQLTARMKADRTVGYDFNFHAPKSVSVVYALTRDERILDAFRAAVSETMQLLEQDAKTRIRKRGEMAERTTGNLCWAEFIHFTARPVNGEPDPHLHAHNFVFNVTHDETEQAWKAVQFREIKRDSPYYEAVFHAGFAARLRELGYDITRGKKSWEITGVEPAVIRGFSRRTALIEELARDKGIVDPLEKDTLGAKTREAKAPQRTTTELREAWSARLTSEQQQQIADISREAQRGMVAAPRVTAAQALDHAKAHEFEQQSVVPARRLLATALRYGVGDVQLNDVEQALPKTDLIVREWEGRRLATTHEVLAEERALLAFAREGRATQGPLNDHWQIQRTWLNPGQQAAVRQIVAAPDRVILLHGKAGTGKTSLMLEAVAAIEAGGHTVLTLAPSAEASRGVLRAEGFETAETVARFLVDPNLQAAAADQVVWIDEAGLLGTKTLAQVFAMAGRIHARVILSGDWRQHRSVERGAALRLIETDAGLKPATVHSIQRQRGAYREAVANLASGQTLKGFEALDQLGWVQEFPAGEREARVAAEYLAGLDRREETLVICPTHAEGDRCTAAIREKLREAGRLGPDEQEMLQLVPKHLTAAERADPVNYETGDLVVLMQNAPGYRKGTRWAYTSALDTLLPQLAEKVQVFRPATLPVAVGDKLRFTAGGTSMDGHRLNNGATYDVAGFTPTGQIVLNNGWKLAADWGHVARGFVSTSHASQGRSVDRVILCQSAQSQGAASQEQFYVSASRGKSSCLILCDSKATVRDQLNRSEVTLSATEFVRDRSRLRQRDRTHWWNRLTTYVHTLREHLTPRLVQSDRSLAYVR